MSFNFPQDRSNDRGIDLGIQDRSNDRGFNIGTGTFPSIQGGGIVPPKPFFPRGDGIPSYPGSGVNPGMFPGKPFGPGNPSGIDPGILGPRRPPSFGPSPGFDPPRPVPMPQPSPQSPFPREGVTPSYPGTGRFPPGTMPYIPCAPGVFPSNPYGSVPCVFFKSSPPASNHVTGSNVNFSQQFKY